MTLILPNNYHIFSATFAVTGAARNLVFTTAGFDGLGLGVTVLTANYRAFLFGSGTTRPFSTSTAPDTLTLLSTNVLKKLGGLLFSDTDFTPSIGLQPTSIAPINCAQIVRKVTGLAGRQYRGRMFAPMVVSEGNVTTAGLVDATPLAALQVKWTSAYNNLVGAGIQPVLLHTDPLIAPTTVTAWTCDERIGTLKRRLRR